MTSMALTSIACVKRIVLVWLLFLEIAMSTKRYIRNHLDELGATVLGQPGGPQVFSRALLEVLSAMDESVTYVILDTIANGRPEIFKRLVLSKLSSMRTFGTSGPTRGQMSKKRLSGPPATPRG